MLKKTQNLTSLKEMFHQMTPSQLCLYCKQHPTYSLPAGIRNYRTKQALVIMKTNAQWLPQSVRADLAAYIKNTFSQGEIVVTPHQMNIFYAPILDGHEPTSNQLKMAIAEFVGFAKAPMTREKKELLDQFLKQITPVTSSKSDRKATAFELGMERYRQLTSLFPHSK